MQLVWWQWVLAIVAGLFGSFVLLFLLALVALWALLSIEDYNRKHYTKRITRYARVLEKLPPTYPLGPDMLGEQISAPWVYPCEGMEPEFYELLLGVMCYDYDHDDNEEPSFVAEARFTAVVDKDTYERAQVGDYIENPLYQRDLEYKPAVEAA